MAKYGLDNFEYEFVMEGGGGKHKFFDPADPTNTAEATVTPKDFPEGVKDADSREIAEIAYSKVSEQMNKKRTERRKKERTDELHSSLDRDERERAAQVDSIRNSQENSVKPVKEEKDGTRVFNTADAPAPTKTDRQVTEADKK